MPRPPDEYVARRLDRQIKELNEWLLGLTPGQREEFVALVTGPDAEGCLARHPDGDYRARAALAIALFRIGLASGRNT